MTEANAWMALAIDEYENQGLSHAEIGLRHGRSADSIYKLMKERGIKRKSPSLRRKGGMVKAEDLPALSGVHTAIGTKLNFDRSLKKKENLQNYGVDLRINRVRLRRMELGVEDFTLSQLMRIADKLGLSLSDLLAPQPKPTVQHGSYPT
jgi:hypothetical protein